jgi:zinc transport system ATP-binding protein
MSGGTSVLVVLHDVGPLGELVDRAVVLSDGRVAHDGPLGDLGQHRRRFGGHEHLDHGPAAADDHGENADSWLGGAVEP